MNQASQQGLIVIDQRAVYEQILADIRNIENIEAIRHIEDFAKHYPGFAPAHNDLACLYYREGDLLKTLANYEKARRLAPSNTTFRKNLADFYFIELQWPDDAIQIYLDILKDNPFDVETLNALGTICMRVDRKELARQYFSRALQLDALNNEARSALEQMEASSKTEPPAQWTPAEQEKPAHPPLQRNTEEKKEKEDDAPEVLYCEASALLDADDTDGAVRQLLRLLDLHPDFAPAHNDLGVLFQRQNDLEKALHHHREAARLQPASAVYQKNLADLLYVGFGNLEPALKIYTQQLSKAPEDVELLYAIASICVSLGKKDDAREFCNRILARQPWHREARELLNSTEQQAETQPAQACVEEPQAVLRSAEEIRTEIKQLLSSDNLTGARTLLEEMLRLDPEDAVAHNDLGVVCQRTGDYQGSRKHHEEAVRLRPASIVFQKNLADLLCVCFEEMEEALKIYVRLQARVPQDIEILKAIAYICRKAGKPTDARFFLERVLTLQPWDREAQEALEAMEAAESAGAAA